MTIRLKHVQKHTILPWELGVVSANKERELIERFIKSQFP